MTAAQFLLAVLFTPLASAAVICCFLRRQGVWPRPVGGCGRVDVSFVAGLARGAGCHRQRRHRVAPLRYFTIELGFLFDGVAATMLTMVAFVGFLIHLFSLGYMKEDKARARFFGGLSIFMFLILGIVLADNLIMIFIFWELVGLAPTC